jgi:hypothetical protein
MINKEIILPYTPEPIKKLLEAKKKFMEKLSKGEDIDQNLVEYANFEIPERLRDKYKRKS